jgi:hypothetical protein
MHRVSTPSCSSWLRGEKEKKFTTKDTKPRIKPNAYLFFLVLLRVLRGFVVKKKKRSLPLRTPSHKENQNAYLFFLVLLSVLRGFVVKEKKTLPLRTPSHKENQMHIFSS